MYRDSNGNWGGHEEVFAVVKLRGRDRGRNMETDVEFIYLNVQGHTTAGSVLSMRSAAPW